MTQQKTALIIGITGGIGNETAKALQAGGWLIRALHRNPAVAQSTADLPRGISWATGDAMKAADVRAAAAGCAVVVHAANPPGYKNWRGLALPMLENAIGAAAAADARLVLPGNIYNYGPDAGALVAEAAPQHPPTEKGQVRVEMEAMLANYCGAGARALIVRAGDFFGGHAPASWMETVIVKPGEPLQSVTWPGDQTTGHAFAYLPDLAETIVRLLDREDDLAAFERVHFAGHWLAPGRQFAESISRLAGDISIKSMPWQLLRLIAPFHTTLREAMAMRYLWQTPIALDNRHLIDLIGAEPHTPLDVALERSLVSLGCLPASSTARVDCSDALAGAGQ